MPTTDQQTHTIDAQRLAPLPRLRREEEIKLPLARAKTALELYWATTIIHQDALDPDRAVEALRRDIERATTASELNELKGNVASILTCREEAKHAAMKICREAYEPARIALVELADKAKELADGYLVEAEISEELFFNQFGIARQQTIVSNRVVELLRNIEQWRASLEAQRTMGGLLSTSSPMVAALDLK